MPHPKLTVALSIIFAIVMTACQKEAPNQTPESNAKNPQSTIAATEGPASAITVEPAALASCNGSVVTVRWDLAVEHPEVTASEVLTQTPQGEMTLFAAGAERGEARTGPWASPGSIFVVRDKATGTEIARAIVGGPDCI